MRKIVVAATAAMLSSAALISVPAHADKAKPQVCLVMKSLSNEFFKDMSEGAKEYAAKRGDFDLKMVGMQSETDFDAQVNAVDTCVTEQKDVIVLAPADSKAMVGPVSRAIKAGATVINFDVPLDDGAKKAAGLDLAFVGPDNADGAKMVGDVLGKLLGKGGKVVILEGNPGADNAKQRKQGFEASIKEYGLELLDSRTAHWETEEANTVFTTMLTAHPDLQGVMAANDSMALGVVKAIEAAGLTGKIQVVGFDNIPAVRPLVKEGKLLATIDQFGRDMASDAINRGIESFKSGAKLEGWVKTDIALVTKDNVK
ncbi:substrate-binding domain-containing protein [Aminobacter aminovorans]|uniref:substrate-binding domain-containing protein n=1 Tax=Aminobacter aminovorans TaxID=83263 RepID=UPI00285C76C0|nr:substrate-binding domain-containing protein [Aminobacter aminovorans]MDR7222377.1 ribose transport system substrate-binding protein [Aminobacter aminovorans]